MTAKFHTCGKNGTCQIPKYSALGKFHENRSRGRPKKRWINNLENDCNDIGLNMVKQTRLTVSDRDKLRCSLSKKPKRGNKSSLEAKQVTNKNVLWGMFYPYPSWER